MVNLLRTELILIRHGETDWNKDERIQGQQDIPLNEKGRSQAAHLKPAMKSLNPDVIYSSDLSRALETASIGTEKEISEIIQDKGLRERCFGSYETHSRQFIRENWDSTFFMDMYGEPSKDIEGAEKIFDFQNRVVESLSGIAKQHPNERIAIFTHGGVIRAWTCKWLEISLTSPKRFHVKNTSIHKFHSDPELEWIVNSIGDTSHNELNNNI